MSEHESLKEYTLLQAFYQVSIITFLGMDAHPEMNNDKDCLDTIICAAELVSHEYQHGFPSVTGSPEANTKWLLGRIYERFSAFDALNEMNGES